MREIILGTAGHVDHGKTSLVRALTGIETDRLKEEKKRGITIELGFAYLDLACGHRLGIVDVPGHERFVKNMVAGAAGVDLVAFIVAADEGIMPQTSEHFEICKLLGIQKGIVVITKIDMVDEEWLDLVEEELADYFAGSFLENAPTIRVSSTTGQGIDAVREALNLMVANSTFYEAQGPFRLPVDRIFTMKGFGAVVTGTSISGKVRIGDSVVLYPEQITCKIRGIQIHNQDVEEVEAGNRTAMNIQGIDKDLIDRGDLLATPGCLDPAFIFDAEFQYLKHNVKELKNRTRVRIHIGTAEIMARIVLLEDEVLQPGQYANVQLLLEKAIGAWPGDRYVVRSYSPVVTIGGGQIFNSNAIKRRRFRQENSAVFETYREGDPEHLVMLHLHESGYHGLTKAALAIRLGIFGKKIEKLLSLPISARKIIVVDSDKQLLMSAEVFGRLGDRMLALLGEFHKEFPLKQGIAKEEIRFKIVPDLNNRIFQMLLAEATKKKKISMNEGLVHLFEHQIVFKEDADKVRMNILASYRNAGLVPPTAKELKQQLGQYPATLVKEIMEALLREGSLVKVSEDLYFAADVLMTLKADLEAVLLRDGEIDAQGFKNLTNLSRKFSIPLLEYFDRIKTTIRIGDKRVLRK